MTCMDAQNLITPFILGQLDLVKLEEFINHINECPVCMEELDVYYALLTSMKQLDEDEELSDNYSEDLKKKIKYYEDFIRKNKVRRIRKRFYLLFMIVSFTLFSSISFGKIQVDDMTPDKPSFLLNYSGIPEKYSAVTALFNRYDQRLGVYEREIKWKRVVLYKNSSEFMNRNKFLINDDIHSNEKLNSKAINKVDFNKENISKENKNK